MEELVKTLVEKHGKLYSEALGIDLKTEEGVFKWFLASCLFGARISEKIASKTYKEFEKNGILSPEKILEAGWDKIVEILDSGGYVRYDFKTATKLLEMSENILKHGGFENIKKSECVERDLENLAKGIGKTTVNIFLREMKGVWNVSPKPQEWVYLAAKNLGIKDLEVFLKNSKVEVALLRLYKNYCRKNLCKSCGMERFCKIYKNSKG